MYCSLYLRSCHRQTVVFQGPLFRRCFLTGPSETPQRTSDRVTANSPSGLTCSCIVLPHCQAASSEDVPLEILFCVCEYNVHTHEKAKTAVCVYPHGPWRIIRVVQIETERGTQTGLQVNGSGSHTSGGLGFRKSCAHTDGHFILCLVGVKFPLLTVCP